jgi:hypothetical protein
VYGSCTQLREYLEARGQGYVLRVPSNFHLTLARGVKLSCKQAAARFLAGGRRWEIRSAGKGSKGARWYAWAWIATTSARHYLLIRRHRVTGELAFHYCHVPEGQPMSLSRLIRAAGLRWPAEENFQFSKGCFGLGQSQVRLYTAIARHTVLVMAALAICAITAALLRRRTSTQARAPARPDQPPPADPGMIPLTVPETGRLLTHPTTAPRRRALAELAPPPSSPLALVPPAHTTDSRDCPGQLSGIPKVLFVTRWQPGAGAPTIGIGSHDYGVLPYASW